MKKKSMMAVTLIQPWAWAIAHAGKRLENRSWQTHVWPDRLAIHAGGKLDKGGVLMLRKAGIDAPLPIVRSAVVAVARVDGVIHAEPDVDDEQRFWWRGPLAWRLADVVPLRKPIPCSGAQGLWQLPTTVEREVEHQVAELMYETPVCAVCGGEGECAIAGQLCGRDCCSGRYRWLAG